MDEAAKPIDTAGPPTGLALSPVDPQFRERPLEVLARLRATEPVHRDRVFDRVFFTRLEDVREVLNDRGLSVDPRNARPGGFHRKIIREGEVFEPTMLHLDDPDHKRVRSLVAQAFQPRAVERLGPRIREMAGALLDEVAERQSFDVIAAYAGPLPMAVLAELFGIVQADRAMFKRWANAMSYFFSPRLSDEQRATLRWGSDNIVNYLARLIEERRVVRGEDLISTLVTAEEEGGRLSTREIIGTCQLLLVAGNITSTDAIGNGVLALLRHPDQLRKLRHRPELVRNAVEEILRYDPPVTQIPRITTGRCEIGGVSLERGESLTASVLSANHDEGLNPEPERFDIERPDPRHFTFGGRAHYCIGAQLARAQVGIALLTLFERFPDLRLDPARPIEHKDAPAFNGLKALWVETRPGDAEI
jgi:cytochrome P450